ncbi:MAG TPA: fibronectin type III domain-containing protein [Candidatus Binatia bacterium]|nr:fibronectin type III domain-containing protein [Candidatus Binatia bacterium]
MAGVRDAAQVANAARGLKAGQLIRLEGIELEGEDGVTGAELEAFEVTTDETVFVVEEAGGSRRVKMDKPVYLRGGLDGKAGSIAVLSVHDDGEIRGIVSAPGATWLMQAGGDSDGGGAAGSRGLRSSKVDPSTRSRKFDCGSAEEHQLIDGSDLAADMAAGGASGAQIAALPLSYTAQIAVELDYEYFLQHGSSVTNAVRYASDLVAFTSSISLSELGMNIKIPFIRVWTTENDPYSGLSNSDRLAQVRSWWNSNDPSHCAGQACTTVKRATTLYLSSARTNGGIAYISALCDAYRSPGSSYGYALVGSISGSFDIGNPRVVWDIVGTSHELGHNFGSQHTHCYQPAVDTCYAQANSNCYSGTASLPAGCPGGGQGCGTIMSYCHLLSGGMSNLTLTYGAGHPYGNTPQRVPSAMISYIASEHAQTPGCFTVAGAEPTAPAPPANLTASTLSSSQIRLAWVDGSNDESGFRISRRTDIDTAWVDVATVGANSTGYTSSGLTAGIKYYYRVRAYNDQGDSVSSNIASASTSGGTVPAAPTGLTAAPMSSTSAVLAWNDNSSNELGFEIRRKNPDGRFKKIAEVAANTRSFIDPNLKTKTQYSYRVRAFNQQGRSKISNTVTITTP